MEKIISREVEHTPALYKIFDEIIVNARDHKVRDASLKGIKVDIGEDGTISAWNDGSGIEVVKHEEHDMWIPELIMGNMLTSSNYNPDEERIVGGRNGKADQVKPILEKIRLVKVKDLLNLIMVQGWGRNYPTYFQRNFDWRRSMPQERKSIARRWRDNMKVTEKPKITTSSAKPFTKITFKPDYNRFEMEGLTDDMRAIFEKRIYDLAATTPSDVGRPAE